MDDKTLLLFSRQILMPSVGVENQQKLFDSCVLIIGAGGFGVFCCAIIIGQWCWVVSGR